jgi:hypothetical protein
MILASPKRNYIKHKNIESHIRNRRNNIDYRVGLLLTFTIAISCVYVLTRWAYQRESI